MANEMARRLRKSMTPHEVVLWSHLRALKRERGFKFRRQVPLRGHIVDFACFEARVVIELDGSQHGDAAHAKRDSERDALFERFGFTVLRFWNAELDENLDGVWRQITEALLETEWRRQGAPHPRP